MGNMSAEMGEVKMDLWVRQKSVFRRKDNSAKGISLIAFEIHFLVLWVLCLCL